MAIALLFYPYLELCVEAGNECTLPGCLLQSNSINALATVNLANMTRTYFDCIMSPYCFMGTSHSSQPSWDVLRVTSLPPLPLLPAERDVC